MNWYRLTAYALLRMFCDSYCTDGEHQPDTHVQRPRAPWYRCAAHALPWYSVHRKAFKLQLWRETSRTMYHLSNLRYRMKHPVKSLRRHLDVAAIRKAWADGQDVIWP